MAAGPGLEPGQHDPESCVLPLHNPATSLCINIITHEGKSVKWLIAKTAKKSY